MNFIIYTLLILVGLYFLLRLFTQVASKKISKGETYDDSSKNLANFFNGEIIDIDE